MKIGVTSSEELSVRREGLAELSDLLKALVMFVVWYVLGGFAFAVLFPRVLQPPFRAFSTSLTAVILLIIATVLLACCVAAWLTGVIVYRRRWLYAFLFIGLLVGSFHISRIVSPFRPLESEALFFTASIGGISIVVAREGSRWRQSRRGRGVTREK